MPKLERSDLLHRMKALEGELENASWFSADRVKKITVEGGGGNEENFELSLFEQIFAAARAHLEGPHVGCLCHHCNPQP